MASEACALQVLHGLAGQSTRPAGAKHHSRSIPTVEVTRRRPAALGLAGEVTWAGNPEMMHLVRDSVRPSVASGLPATTPATLHLGAGPWVSHGLQTHRLRKPSRLPSSPRKRACSCFNIETTKSSRRDEEARSCGGTATLSGSWIVFKSDSPSDNCPFSRPSACQVRPLQARALQAACSPV